MFFFKRKRAPLRLSDLSEADIAELLILGDRKERSFIEKRLGVPVTNLSDFSSYLEVGYKKVWATFRACHLTANVLVSARFQLRKLDNAGNTTEVSDPRHPVNVLTSSPNPFDSWEDLIYMWVFHMKLCGTAYWLKDGANAKGQPLALFPLLPQYVEVMPDPINKVKEYRYKVNGQTLTLTPEQIIHFRRPHPNDFIRGLGDVEAGQDLLAGHIDRGALGRQFISNGAAPSGVLTKEEAEEDDVAWELLRDKFNKRYAGKANAGKVAFLNGKWSYHRLGLTMNEMEAIEHERWSIEQIFLTHGVPLSVAGLKDAANYATAKQDSIAFRKNEAVPLIDALVGRLNMPGALTRTFDDTLRLGYSVEGLLDVEQAVKEYGGLVDKGALTPNQLRVLAGQERVDDPYLDQYYIDQRLIPLVMAGMSGQGAQPPQQ